MIRLFPTHLKSIPDRRTAIFCGLISLFSGITALAGWSSDLLTLARIRETYIPMSPDTAFLFVIFGLLLILGGDRTEGKRRTWLVALLWLISFYGLLQFSKFFHHDDFFFERLLFPSTGKLGLLPLARMSPVTGLLFFVAAGAMMIKLLSENRHAVINTSSGLAITVALSGFIASMGYLFNTPFLYGGDVIPLAATTSLGFLALGSGIAALTSTGSIFLQPFTGPNASARLLRGILPIIVALVLIHGVVSRTVIEKFGLNEALFSALLTLLFMFITGAVVIHLSRIVFRHADQADAERHKAEEELYRSRQMLQLILDDIPQRVFCKDLNSRYLWCNMAFARDAGLSGPDQIIGRNDFELPWKNQAELYRSDDLLVMDSGTPKLHYLEPLLTQDGKTNWLQTSKMPLRDNNGQIFGVLGSFEDVTERKIAEEALLIAKNQAEAANRAKDEFLSSVSHELLTPLNGILGFSEILDSSLPMSELEDGDEIRNQLQTIHECGETLLGIITDVLELSRIEAGQFEAVTEKFVPEKLIGAAVETFRFSAGNKRIELDFLPHGLPPVVIGDSRRLKQILFNVIGNAIKFTEKGSVEVIAGLDGTNLVITIKDTGIGIPTDKQPMIMQPFLQADQSNSRKYGGAGLGLSIVFRILKLLGGKIEFTSRTGLGTAFTITFPIKTV